MILQNAHYVVDCPICGRPLELQSKVHSREMACGHCRGEFIVHETDDGSLAAANGLEMDLMSRAELLLRVTCDATSLTTHGGWEHSNGARISALEELACETELRPTALCVEHRDEVFARVATDMAKFGVRVVRAKSASEALALCGKYDPVLVIANVDLPDHSGWLLACKLRFIDSNTPIWLYQTRSSHYDHGMVKFLKVDELLDHDGDLLGLSDTIIELMSGWRKLANGSNESRAITTS